MIKGVFTWSGGPRSGGVGFFCFHALGHTKQKKPTPLDRGPPLHVNRVLMWTETNNTFDSCHTSEKKEVIPCLSRSLEIYKHQAAWSQTQEEYSTNVHGSFVMEASHEKTHFNIKTFPIKNLDCT